MDFHLVNYDLLMVMLLVIIYVITRGNQMLITTVAFTATVVLSESFIFDGLDSIYVHILYGIVLIPFILISSMKGAAALSIYALANLYVSYDYIFYQNAVTILKANYDSIYNLLDLCIILLSLERGYNVDRSHNTDIFSIFHIERPELCTQKAKEI